MIGNVAKQAKQIAQDTFEQAVKVPGEVAGRAMEQLGATPTGKALDPLQKQAQEQKAQIERLKAEDRQKSLQLAGQIEAEIEKWRQVRKQEDEARKKQEENVDQTVQPTVFREPLPRPKRGFFGMGKRVKSAQEQSQPETSALRSGG